MEEKKGISKWIWVVGIVVVILIIILISQKPKETGPIKIGGLFMLTGPSASFGEFQKRSAELAANEMNLKGGIDGRKVEFVSEDTAGDPKKAVDAYYALKNQGVKIFMAEGSSVVAAVRKLIIDDNGFILTSGATTPAYFDDNNRSCRLTMTAKVLGPAFANYLLDNGYKKASYLFPDNEYGKGLADEFTKAYVSKGGLIVVSEFFNAAGTADYRTNITKIKSLQADTDALVTVNMINTVESMFQQISQLGWNKLIVSDYNTISNPALKNLSLAEGVKYLDWPYTPKIVDTDSLVTKNFKTSYAAQFNTEPSLLAAGYYDGAATIISAIEHAGTNTEKMGAYLSSLKNYGVVTGNISSFDNDCEAKRDVIFRKISGGKVENI
jgi:branched-chain amino acid transport system substrate-binding protein